MSITRRQFLLGMTGTAAGLVVPTYLTKATQFLEETGNPLILSPKHIETELFAAENCGEFDLYLGAPDDEPPKMTYRQYAEYSGYDDINEFMIDWELEKTDLESEIDDKFVVDLWGRRDSPNANAFYLLEGLDLMPESGYPGTEAFVHFIDGCCPGNDYLGVEVPNALSLSLLQERLNQLNTGIRITVEGGVS